jgi:cellulose synthase/poly-beta-1,6-N-acetylglucosamine synthase-like glycosyltransferase
MSDAADDTREGGIILVDAPKCNVVGAYVIAGYVLVLVLYLGSCVFSRWLASRGRMPEVASGKFRLAAATGRVDMMIGIKKSLGAAFDIDCNVLGFTALHSAVCQGELGAVLWLLQNGANVSKVKEDGWKNTALHYAASRGNQEGHQEIIRVLFAFGARLDLENFAGETAAQVAANMGHRLVSRLLKDLEGGHSSHSSSFPSRPSSSVEKATATGAEVEQGAERSRVQRWSRVQRSAGCRDGQDGEDGEEGQEALLCHMRSAYDGCYFSKRVDPLTKLVKWEKKVGHVFEAEGSELEEYMKRGNQGYGTPGTEPGRYLRGFRRIAVVYLIISFLYLLWRALRSLNPGWWYFYSIPFFMIELTGWTLGLVFVYSLFYQIDRPSRSITRMLEQEEFPKTAVYICRYSEPVEVLEATTVAALNMDYPGEKLAIYVLDDGKSDEVREMCTRLRYQLRYMDRRASLHYVARTKKAGVPHHAKAGNINNALLMNSPEDTQYILVLDCDMIVHPTFLHRTLSHFYAQAADGGWRQKEFVGLLQTPQDFWNVDSEDPMVHCARFFYGPMLQGRDGAGACPCCGTGVIFPRSTLVSVGGQSYGSITEDCNSSMQLLSSGFANMFLNERLVYGMAPEDLAGVFLQRARWAMGALQILYRDNPLRKRGLTMSQSFLFFEIGAHHYLAIGTALATLVPLVYVYVEASPVIVEYLWEFCIVFAVFFFTNRIMIWWAHRGCASGGTLELWRGGQMWIWMCPSHIKAILKTFISETDAFSCLGSFQLTFKVTDKGDGATNFWESFWFASPFILYLVAVLGSTIYFIVVAVLRRYSTWVILMTITAIAWSVYISLCIWPPVSVLLPRVETDQGWKISWDTAIDESKLMVDEKKRVVRRPKGAKAASKGRLDRGAGSLISETVKEMEEGKHRFDFSGLTEHAVDAFRLDKGTGVGGLI